MKQRVFKITPAQLKAAITPKTKVLLFNTPSNPTGSVYSKAELEGLAEVLKGTNVLVVSDEMYEKILFDNLKFTSVASISEDMFNRTITVNGLSKSVAMPGWRLAIWPALLKRLWMRSLIFKVKVLQISTLLLKKRHFCTQWSCR